MTQNELTHYGKLGMRWGVRKSPTVDDLKTGNKLVKETGGLVRGGREINTAVKKHREQRIKNTPQRKPRGLSQMTDKELQAKVQRLNMERQYADLTRQPQQRLKGQEALETTLNVAGGVVTAVGSALSIALMMKQLSGN